MRNFIIYPVIFLFANTISMYNPTAPSNTANKTLEENPLLQKWEGAYNGVPPFDKVEVEQFKPALEAGMAENLSEIDKITANNEAASFENTIAAMERSGKTLDRVNTIYGIWSSNMNSPEFQAVESECMETCRCPCT